MKIHVPDKLLFKLTPAQARALQLVYPRIRKGPRQSLCEMLDQLDYEGRIRQSTADAVVSKILNTIELGYLSEFDFGVSTSEFESHPHLYRRAWVRALLRHNGYEVKP